MKRILSSRPFLLAMPWLILGSMYLVYTRAAAALGVKLGYFSGFVVYWLVWCLAVPAVILGWSGIKAAFAAPRRLSGAAGWLQVAILAGLPTLAFLFGPFRTNYPQASALIVFLSFLLAAVNAPLEDLLWRALYTKMFPDNALLGFIYPAVTFALWHLAPQSVFASTGGRFTFVAQTLLLGLGWGWAAYRTGSVRWVSVSHILLDFSGIGALFYFR